MLTLEEEQTITEIVREHQSHPEQHLAQKFLAKSVTRLVHGSDLTSSAESLSHMLFKRSFDASRVSNPDQILTSNRLRTFHVNQNTGTLSILAFLQIVFPEHSKGIWISSLESI